MFKYKNGTLLDHKNVMLGYVALKEWLQDII
jgi:hypothetical protein